MALHIGDLAALHQPLQALVEPADDAVAVGVDPGHVDALQAGLDTEVRALASGIGDLRRMQQGLGGDAAAVQARTAELVLFHEDHREAQL